MNREQQGFTLIEAIMVIVITGILAGVVAVFIKGPIGGYFDTERRANLTDSADTALRLMARELRSALPNSLRSTTGGSDQCFEFIPIVGSGRYSTQGAGDILDFSISDSSFDVLASSNLPTSFKNVAVEHVVVYNLGIPGADAYVGNNRAQIDTSSASAATSTNIVLNTSFQFRFPSPGNRFDVVPDSSIVYSCIGGAIRRSTRSIGGALASCPDATAGTVVVNNVSACSFKYTPAVNARNGLLAMTLVLTDPTESSESVRLYQEVHVNNAP